ncbi:hypothetical protein PIB30_070257 [Stylosanthes scabra]|uniref:Uncharacterized protein n=1 Tax=Stylosanthes scabra TaxID=79078 RepID=A0ABU6WP44_9FABA|nr:hypothetical protein [Stylosanthes scabra]
MSYVKGRAIMLDRSKLSECLGHTEAGICVFTSGNWERSLNLTYQEALVCICENPSALDGVIPTHRSFGPATERVLVQKLYIDKLKADHMFSDAEDEEEGNMEDDSEPSDA